ncbi:MAG: 2-succinyl-6-hydroxy-2,4-cyclohexadiene-1-carboxylate synthase [Deltaproteobacteria bacterium]|nr:2-succinyl-6-hydroxy-2,4-cyclohexadiene-1-carboxylate synthase [Deltaproteobacteria bacterium]
MALHRWGEGGAEPLVCLHGFTGRGESWRPLGLALGGRRAVLAPDLPGHGGTRAAAFTTESASALLVEALARVGVERFSLLGYSLGGRLALSLALDHPRSVGRLVVESASPGLASAEQRAERRGADAALADRLEREGVAAFVARWEAQPLFATLARLPEGARRALRAQRLAQDAAALAAALRGLGTGAQPWLGDRLHELAPPALIVAGAEDGKFRDWAAWMQARIPCAELAIVEGAGHVPHLEQPEAFLRRVGAFLEPSNEEESCRFDGRR